VAKPYQQHYQTLFNGGAIYLRNNIIPVTVQLHWNKCMHNNGLKANKCIMAAFDGIQMLFAPSAVPACP